MSEPVTKLEVYEIEKFIDDMEYYFGINVDIDRLNRLRDILYRLRDKI